MKHSYQTRRLLAMRDLRHDGQNVIAGGEVFATETDANYLIRSGHAREADTAPAPAPTATAAISTPARRGRPTRAEIAARTQASNPGPDAGTSGTASGEGSGEQSDLDAGAADGEPSSDAAGEPGNTASDAAG